MGKNIKDLTKEEAEEILKFVYPNKENQFTEISFEPKIENGQQHITFGFRSIIGILYHNGQDNCILHFDNTKVVLWLYKNGYDISEFLELNSYMSEMESDFENFSFAIHWLMEQRNMLNKENKNLFTIDYIFKELKQFQEKYYYKDYE